MAHPPIKKAVVLLSGGLDSATVLAHVSDQNYDVYALSFSYGQRQGVELEAAQHLATQFKVKEHKIVHMDLRAFGGSALTDDIEVPKDRSSSEMEAGIPITYVPARNTIFLSYALGYAEVIGAFDIFCGVNALDYSGYPDCRPEFIEAFQTLANLATSAADGKKDAFSIHAPLIHLGKGDIIKMGTLLGLDYAMTHSCYDPQEQLACGRCDACALRKKGFSDAAIPDPTRYL